MTTTPAYYNEIDPYAAQWLRNLMDAGHIAPGWVDERSIEDVKPWEIEPFTQCHFFAGIGVWSLALRRAGWPDDRPIWTGSCPCQPFSASGKREGFADERHLWPSWQWLVEQCRPELVIGEQVASKATDPWFDLVQADLEALGYAFGVVPFPSAGVGAPHIRDRAYWVGHADDAHHQQHRGRHTGASGRAEHTIGGATGRLADPSVQRRQHESQVPRGYGEVVGATESRIGVSGNSNAIRVADSADGAGLASEPRAVERRLSESDGSCEGRTGAGPTNGLWGAADWLLCRDGKWRPVEPGTFPLAHGAASRVGRLRAYGNAINAEAARVFIECLTGLVE